MSLLPDTRFGNRSGRATPGQRRSSLFRCQKHVTRCCRIGPPHQPAMWPQMWGVEGAICSFPKPRGNYLGQLRVLSAWRRCCSSGGRGNHPDKPVLVDGPLETWTIYGSCGLVQVPKGDPRNGASAGVKAASFHPAGFSQTAWSLLSVARASSLISLPSADLENLP